MSDKSISNECQDPTQTLTVSLPCQLAERVERYAQRNDSTVTGVLIEALDQFMRNQGKA